MIHITIIGSGAIGLSTALALLKRGFQVSLIERGEVGAESTWAGGGILCPLLPWDYQEPVSRLALASMRMYADWIAEIEQLTSLSPEYWRCGMRIMTPESIDQALDWCRTHGLPAEKQPSDNRNLWLPDVAQARNPRLAAALRRAVEMSGGRIHTMTACERVIVDNNRIIAVQSGQTRFPADYFVFCTGAWAGLPLVGLPAVPNIRPIRGQMLLYKLNPGVLDMILYRQGNYVIPRLDGHVLVGSTLEDAGFDKSTHVEAAHHLHQTAVDMLPALVAATPLRHWAGLRPGAPDNVPVIARQPGFENVFVNTGHYRYGLTMAPAAAELLADLITDTPPAVDPAPYSWSSAQHRQWTGLR